MTLSVPHVRVQLKFPCKSGVPADATMINLFYRPPGGTIPIDPGSGSVAIDNLAAIIGNFLNVQEVGQTETPGSLLGPSVLRGSVVVEMTLYQVPVNRGFSGPPIALRLITLSGTAPTNGYPNEVAIACTYHGDLTNIPERGPNNTRPASNRRGRFYWGPLNNTVSTIDASTGRVHVASNVAHGLLLAMDRHLHDEAAQASWNWAVFSRTLWQDFPVVGGAVDDAFDTQRRRGQDPIVREHLVFT